MLERLSKIASVDHWTFVAEPAFVLATRDTGYRSLAAAVAELIDNAVQASATTISIHVRQDACQGLSVAAIDDGCGMDRPTLRSALQFGGTPRFNDRSGQGRFGMGLPNSSVSQARRVDVYSWRNRDEVLHTHLDVDEIVSGALLSVPLPRRSETPSWMIPFVENTGTAVVWSKCDRLADRDIPSIAKDLHRSLGRMFRRFLAKRILLSVNGVTVTPVDPLFLSGRAPQAKQYGRELPYSIRIPTSIAATSTVRVRFAELPVGKWHDLPITTKRSLGIVKGGGVSVLRADREIAYGWYFMGGKRRENYDDWWRCEVAFEPGLDELFGVTHSKQAINPTPELIQILSPDLEAIAHTLNARVRARYSRVRAGSSGPAVKAAAKRERQLVPIKHPKGNKHDMALRVGGRLRYRLKVAPLDNEAFYSFRLTDDEFLLLVNEDHPFFTQIYRAVRQRAPRERFAIECLLLALARAEAAASSNTQRYWYRHGRQQLSNVLAAFLGG